MSDGCKLSKATKKITAESNTEEQEDSTVHDHTSVKLFERCLLSWLWDLG